MSSLFKSLKVNVRNTRKLTDCCQFQNDKCTGKQVSKTHGYIAGTEYMHSVVIYSITRVYPQYI